MQLLKLKTQLYYALINSVLVKRIEKEIRKSFKAIVKSPESFQCRYFNIRVFWLNKFPYSIYYLSENNQIVVVAFWHSKEDINNKLPQIL